MSGCRAKHQKLKTGNDQSPGDKKPETEADQRMFTQTLLLCSYLEMLCELLSLSAETPQKKFLFLFSAVASLLNHLFSIVPNGPAESDAEPANQMSWKEGRQLLRK